MAQPLWKPAVALALACSTGCSLVFVKRPSPDAAGPPPDCTTSRAAPVADFVVGGVAAAAGVSMLARQGKSCDQGFACVGNEIGREVTRTTGMIALGTGLLTVASGLAGFHWTGQCRDLLAAPPLTARRRPDLAPSLVGPGAATGVALEASSLQRGLVLSRARSEATPSGAIER